MRKKNRLRIRVLERDLLLCRDNFNEAIEANIVFTKENHFLSVQLDQLGRVKGLIEKERDDAYEKVCRFVTENTKLKQDREQLHRKLEASERRNKTLFQRFKCSFRELCCQK